MKQRVAGRRFGKKAHGRCNLQRQRKRKQFPNLKLLIRQVRKHGLEQTRVNLVTSAADVGTCMRELHDLVEQHPRVQQLISFQVRRAA